MKLRLRIIMEYEADPAHYDTGDPIKMAQIDEDNYNADPGSMYSILDASEYQIIVDAPRNGYVKGGE